MLQEHDRQCKYTNIITTAVSGNSQHRRGSPYGDAISKANGWYTIVNGRRCLGLDEAVQSSVMTVAGGNGSDW